MYVHVAMRKMQLLYVCTTIASTFFIGIDARMTVINCCSTVSQECPGIEDGSELNTGNVMDFVNCTIITGNLIINFQSRSLR